MIGLPRPLQALSKYALIGGAAVLALVIAGLLAAAAHARLALAAERTAHAQTKTQFAEAITQAERSARQWEARAHEQADRARESNHAAQRTIDQQAAELARAHGRIARLSADADGLRQQFAAAGAQRGADDSLASCVAWSRALADALAAGAGLVAEGVGLLAEGASLAGQSAEAHDRRAAEVMALVRGWPHQQSTPGPIP